VRLCRLSLGDFAMGSNFEQIMAQLAAQHEPLPQPTSRDVLKSMPHVKVTSAAASPAASNPADAAQDSVAPVAKAGEACTICHDEFTDGMEVTQLPGCGHCFHGDCITQWLEQVCAPSQQLIEVVPVEIRPLILFVRKYSKRLPHAHPMDGSLEAYCC